MLLISVSIPSSLQPNLYSYFFINTIGFEAGGLQLQFDHLIDTADQILTSNVYISVLICSSLESNVTFDTYM